MAKRGWILLLLGTLMLCGLTQRGAAQPAADASTRRAKVPKAKPNVDARQLEVSRLSTAPRIDGRLDEAFGTRPLAAEGFVQYAPEPGKPSAQVSHVWVGYDDEALYIVARLEDTNADLIEAQLSERDRLRNTDWFGVTIAPYRDGINASTFIVTPAGVQYDAKFTASSNTGGNQIMTDGDRSWNAVWMSAASVDEGGWTVEFKIPYSALRFPEADVQTWDINFGRSIRRFREESHWRPVDPLVPGFVTQMGRLTGIRNVKPPVRFQATPFVTATASHSSDPDRDARNLYDNGFGGGLDIKYGLSDAFTLDMTLVPDFSNARSDDQILNLGANEVRFDENRDFFTEGVELFNKGNFFYSRRIGGAPINYSRAEVSLLSGEEIIDNPVRAQLVNATKVSGRTESGLGIGVFNAVEKATVATIRNNEDQSTREVVTSPITNYSVVSLDQNLPNNSFVTLINTNVMRGGSTYDANLTGLVYDLRTAGNTWSLNGKAAISQKYQGGEGEFGHTYNIGIDKLTGRLLYGAGVTVETHDYDPRDLGFLSFGNERSAGANVEYNWFEPIGPFNSISVGAWTELQYLYKPSKFASAGGGYRARLTTREFFTFGVSGYTDLAGARDFQDTRTPGRYIQFPAYTEVGGFISSDYRKAFAYDVRGEYGGTYASSSPIKTFRFSAGPRYRFSDKLEVRADMMIRRNDAEYGYVGHTAASAKTYRLDDAGTNYNVLSAESGLGFESLGSDAIVIGYRDVNTVEAELGLDYAFKAQMTASLRVRHYWSAVTYSSFATIDDLGTLLTSEFTGRNDDGDPQLDRNFNAFNVDLFYRWRFAPGSDLLISYKTVSFFGGAPGRPYFDNLNTLGDERVDNSITVKAIYWLDYDGIRRKLKR